MQNITYRLTTEDTAAFGMLPPDIVVADGSGDCDSKALLAVVILPQLIVDAVVLLASGLGHVPPEYDVVKARKVIPVEVQ